MSYFSWIAILWCGCAFSVVIFERFLAHYTTGFVDPEHPARSVAIFATLLTLSPIILPVVIIFNARVIQQWSPWLLSFGKGQDPYTRYDQDWPTDRDMFLGMLIRRRKLFDPRLSRANIGKWPMREFWSMPEAIVLEAVDADRDLRSGGAADWQIWEKLDTWLDVDGPPVAGDASILEFLRSRMRFIDPHCLDLDDRVLSGHVDICHRWLGKTKPVEGNGFPPLGWLTKRLSFAEFESMKAGAEQSYADAPAVLQLSRSQQKLAHLKLRMLGGDEVWAFCSPAEYWRQLGGRAGIALVRDGRMVAHVVTEMN